MFSPLLFILLCLPLISSPFVIAPRTFTSKQPSTLHLSSSPSSPPPPPLTPARIATLVEVSFVNACTQLSTGYVDVLKMFIVSSKAGYTSGLTIPQLILELSQCSSKTAGRDLMHEEVDLRTVWLSLVYLTLERINHPRQNAQVELSVSSEIRGTYTTFVYDVVNAHKSGFTLQSLKLEEIMKREVDAPQRTEIEEAILSQSMRLIFLTLEVLKEEEEFKS